MPEENTSTPNSKTTESDNLGGSSSGEGDRPTITPEQRARMLLTQELKKSGHQAETTQEEKPPKPEKKSEETKVGDQPKADKQSKPQNGKPSGAESSEEKPKEKPSEERVSHKEPPKEDEEKPGTPKDWEKIARSHQSRADKLYEDHNRLAEEKKTVEEDYRKLKEDYEKMNTVITKFQESPLEFIQEHLPEIAESLRQHGNPVEVIETRLSEYKDKLDETFKKQYGDDWQYKESESLTPKTASFRYRMALEDEKDRLRRNYQDQVRAERDRVEQSQKTVEEDKQKLKQEFDLTNEDIEKIDEWMNNTKLSYYLLAQLALQDKILERKLESIVPPERPPEKEITDVPGGDGEDKDTQKLSDTGRSVASRLGFKNLI